MSRERSFYLKATLALYLGWAAAFEAVGRYAARLPARDLTSALDRAVPFDPRWAWPYELCYLFPFLPLFLVRDWHRFNRAALAVLLATASAFAVYLALPIAFPRPDPGPTLAGRILAMEYAADFHPGANKLPSLHVALAWIFSFASTGRHLPAAGRAAIFGGAVAITASTVLVKQHLIIDAVSGIAWGVGAWWLAGLLLPRLSGGETEPAAGFKRMIRIAAPGAALVSGALVLIRALAW